MGMGCWMLAGTRMCRHGQPRRLWALGPVEAVGSMLPTDFGCRTGAKRHGPPLGGALPTVGGVRARRREGSVDHGRVAEAWCAAPARMAGLSEGCGFRVPVGLQALAIGASVLASALVVFFRCSDQRDLSALLTEVIARGEVAGSARLGVGMRGPVVAKRIGTPPRDATATHHSPQASCRT